MTTEEKKIITLALLIMVLIVLFIGYGLSLTSTPESRERRILSYLENKYHTEFEIAEFDYSYEKEIVPEIGCDGTTFQPAIHDNAAYVYHYEVWSTSDHSAVHVSYIDNRFKDEIKEESWYSYFHSKTEDEIHDYVVRSIGEDKIEDYLGGLRFIIDEDFDEICDADYIKKLKKMSAYVQEKNLTYMQEKTDKDRDTDFDVHLLYSDDVAITFEYGDHPITVNTLTSENPDGIYESVYWTRQEFIKTYYYSLEEYLENRGK